jgi:flagellar assembly protein FliH
LSSELLLPARLVDPSEVAPIGPLPLAHEAPTSVEDGAFAAGFAAGRAAALAEEDSAFRAARQALDDAAKSLRAAASELARARSQAVALAVDEAARFALELTEAIVGGLPRQLSPRLVERALSLVPEGQAPVVKVHPEEVEALQGLVAGVSLVADASVAKGGCVVEAGPTRIGAEIGPALRRLRAVLAGGLEEQPNEGDDVVAG